MKERLIAIEEKYNELQKKLNNPRKKKKKYQKNIIKI